MNNRSYSLSVKPGSPLTSNLPVEIPGDKSISHRAALLAGMANGVSKFENYLISGVTKAMLDALAEIGINWSIEEANTLIVHGKGLDFRTDQLEPVYLNCGNSATTLRLLAGGLSAWGIPAILDGSSGLRRRPMRRIIEPLQQMGIQITSNDGSAPLILEKFIKPLRAIEHKLPVASAQVKSCLLIAGLAANGEMKLIEPGPSRDHTERMLRSMGAQVITHVSTKPGNENPQYITCLTPLDKTLLSPLEIRLPGDMSAAAFLIVAALITPGSQLTLHGVGLNPTRTGLLDALVAMGADIEIHNVIESGYEPQGDITLKYSHLHGVKIQGEQVVRMIDEFPIFSIAAANAHGITVVAEAEELRHKESDRIRDMCKELHKLGGVVEETPDGFIIEGGKQLEGGVVESHGDHRLAMSLAVAGLTAKSQVVVRDAHMMQESFPEFDMLLRNLGAQLERIA